MRKLKQAIAEWRWGPLPERRARGLVQLHDVLAGTGFHRKYWMVLGLLLGCMRDGGPIPWDRDADFAFHEKDLPAFLAAFEELRRQGFSPARVQVNNDGSITKWAVRREGVKYEFFLFAQLGNKLRWFYHCRKPRLELVNEIPVHGLDEFELYGRRWLKPDNADAWLTALYGDWRVPNPHYVYWRDCGATVDRYPWSGERRGV